MKLEIGKICTIELEQRLILSLAVLDNGDISSYGMIHLQDKPVNLNNKVALENYPCICRILDSTNLGYTDKNISKASIRNLNPEHYTLIIE